MNQHKKDQSKIHHLFHKLFCFPELHTHLHTDIQAQGKQGPGELPQLNVLLSYIGQEKA